MTCGDCKYWEDKSTNDDGFGFCGHKTVTGDLGQDGYLWFGEGLMMHRDFGCIFAEMSKEAIQRMRDENT